MKVKDLIIKTEKVPWRSLTQYQPEDFKKIDKNQTEQLIHGILDIGIATAFYVWEENNVIYVFDGHQRLKVFPEMINRGIEIPDEFTCNFVAAENKEHAIKIVLAYNSHASEIDEKGFFNFIGNMDLDDINKKFQFFKTGHKFFDYMKNEVPIKNSGKLPKVGLQGIKETEIGDYFLLEYYNEEEREYWLNVLGIDKIHSKRINPQKHQNGDYISRGNGEEE